TTENPQPSNSNGPAGQAASDLHSSETTQTFESIALAELERRQIMATLEHVENNKSKAARLLGIERSTLDRKLKRYQQEG
ncbi:MAG TPA: sigma-54-dependent Fis family transcriptional regulator, partial [Planctomycetaceae bacterium]|nr:sigma-54-dependent Fis family transcriptional regulator [Planctomycetaceae bacterium]